jgi:plasmid stabilization system protein ParE
VFAVEKHMICYLVGDSQIDVLRVLHRRMDVDSHVF